MAKKIKIIENSELETSKTLENPCEFDIMLHGSEIVKLSEAERKIYLENVFQYWRKKGFPYPNLTNEKLTTEYRKLDKDHNSIIKGDELTWSPVGLSIINHFQPQIWETKCEGFRTPLEVFQSDILLKECLKKTSEIWKDRIPFNDYNLRRALAIFKNTKRISNFRPTVAKALYQKFTKPNDKILDLSAGYGGRLLGVLPLKRVYYAIDPCAKTVTGLKKINNRFNKDQITKASVKLFQCPAEKQIPLFSANSVDFAIWSPPFFKRERYSDEMEQSYKTFGSYQIWKTDFLFFVFKQICRVLKDGAFFALNIANTKTHSIEDDACYFLSNKLTLRYVFKMKIGCVPYHRNGNRGGYRSENIYIYSKS